MLEENGGIQKPVIVKKAAKQKQEKKRKKDPPAKKIGVRITTQDARPVERIDEAVRFIKRYAVMHGKVKTGAQILHFINSLQRAIVEKRIRKTSPYAKEVNYMQDKLIKLYNVMADEVEIKVNDKVLKSFMTIAGSQKVRLSVNYLKRYIGIQGKHITKDKAKKLIELMKGAVKKGDITKSDPYAARLDKVFQSLQKFIDVAGHKETLTVHPAVLNGINEALNSCICCDKKKDQLDGVDQPLSLLPTKLRPEMIINSMDFAKMKFETLGFMGKWRDFIGDPSSGFTAMVYGRPKLVKAIYV